MSKIKPSAFLAYILEHILNLSVPSLVPMAHFETCKSLSTRKSQRNWATFFCTVCVRACVCLCVCVLMLEDHSVQAQLIAQAWPESFACALSRSRTHAPSSITVQGHVENVQKSKQQMTKKTKSKIKGFKTCIT